MNRNSQSDIWKKALPDFIKAIDEVKNAYILETKELLTTIVHVFKKYPDWSLTAKIWDSNVFQGLTNDARMAFFLIVGSFCTHFSKPFEAWELCGTLYTCFKNGVKELMENDWVERVAFNGSKEDMANNQTYVLSAKAARYLFKGQRQLINVGSLSEFGTFYHHEDIRYKELSFPCEMMPQLNRIVTATRSDKYSKVVKEMRSQGFRNGLTMLFYGPPGTGKTEFALQLAKRNKLDFLSVDYSKLDGSFFGEGPRAIKELFRSFSLCAAISSRPPIMFLDEADAIFTKRVSVVHASDKESNTVTNIILDEMNRFSGILIAATNHLENISSAMNRRFLFKQEFSLPDSLTRAIIWKKKIPWINSKETEILAQRYSFSAGIMDNVASICVLEKVLTGETPPFSFIEEQCKGQVVGKGDVMPKIGFHTNQ